MIKRDLTQQTFGKLTVLQSAPSDKYGNAMWFCSCECGNTTIAQGSSITAGRTKSCGCWRKQHGKRRFGKDNPNWKGGKPKSSRGYTLIRMPEHPRAHAGYVLEHIVVMEQKLGRSLLPNENVHHINGIRSDNRLDNLELWTRSQPSGKRSKDLVVWAKQIIIQEILTKYR